ncbi:MAG TPA: exosortase K [Pyrinomonadaceae bacterium]
MNRSRIIWGAQLSVVLLCALALKSYYSTATPDELRWILAPTTALVEVLSGRSFVFESYTGYMSSDHTFVIAVPCAGVNFLLTAFLMIGVRRLWRNRFQGVSWRFLPIAVLMAYAATLIANTARICIALEMQRRAVEVSWLTGNQLHRLEGIVVYFGFLLLLFMLIERLDSPKPLRLKRVLLFPLLIYYATTLGIPLLNGSFRQPGFWEHFGFVLVLPLIIVLPFVLFVPFRGNHLRTKLYRTYRWTMLVQKSAYSSRWRGALVWCGLMPFDSGVKQNVSVTSKGSSAVIMRSNHAS